MDLQTFGLFIAVFLVLLLGIFVLTKSTKKEYHIVYSTFALWVAFWTLGIAIFRLSSDYEVLLFWNKEFIFTASLLICSLLHFSLVFPYQTIKLSALKRALIYLPNIFVLWGLFTPGIFIKDIVIGPGGNESILGWGYPLYGIYFGIFSFLAFANLYIKFKKERGLAKLQLFYVLIGLLISLAFGSTFNLIFILLGNYEWIWLGPYASFIMLFFIGYAIIVYRLMDIKLVFRKSTVFILSILTVVLVGASVKLFYEHYIGVGLYTGDILMLVVAVILYDPLKKRYFVLANKYFFSSYYDSRKLISDISENLRNFLNTEKIYDYIYGKLSGAFHFQAFGVLFYDKRREKYRAVYNKGFELGRKQFFKGDQTLRKEFIEKNRPVVIEEVKSMYKSGHVKKLINYLEKIGVNVIAPLNSQDETVGILAFGPKESGDMYNEEDLEVIKIVGAQAAVTIENARLYEKTKDFNVKLKKEVDKATRNLRAANERLRCMDQAKTDFISIASHQLRTPLTVIKGYISMFLEGTFGKVNKKQEQALQKVFDSSNRLIDLVEDLLNISRIESGRMEYNFKKTRLQDEVENVCEELKAAIDKKGLELVYKDPPKNLPKVNADPEKIRQVIMNLIDNAIKYTNEGSVTVGLKRIKHGVEFCVEDTGMGFNSEEKDNLFQKFSRNEKTDLVHTEGTGLGLYVAKQIVESHHGKIWADSPGKGKGSKFCFTLPTGKNAKKK